MVRAKFKVERLVLNPDGGEVTMNVVTMGSQENEKFFRWTPFGSIQMGTINKEAIKEFEVGKEFYVDFTEVPS